MKEIKNEKERNQRPKDSVVGLAKLVTNILKTFNEFFYNLRGFRELLTNII
jgi:hypothetical protein